MLEPMRSQLNSRIVMRLLLLALTFVFILLQGRLWFSNDGMRGVQFLDDAVIARSEENRSLAVRNSALEAEVLNLKNELAAAEERARTELGMVAESETFYQITPSIRPMGDLLSFLVNMGTLSSKPTTTKGNSDD